MRLPAALLGLLSLGSPALAHATPAHVWSHRWVVADDQGVYSVAVDPSGNIVACGNFYSELNFGTHYNAVGAADAYVVKFDAAGNPLWSHAVGTSSSDAFYQVKTDIAGNVIAVGDGGSGANDQDGVVAKYGPDGTQRWLKHFNAGDGKFQTVDVVATDALKNVVIAGEFDDSIDLGGGPLLETDDDRTMFLAKLDQLGNHVWSKRFVMTTDEVYYIAGMETDAAGHIIVFGFFSGSIDFGNGPVVSTGGRDLFLAQFDSDGNVLWSHAYGGAGQQYSGALAVNESGKIAITGFVDAAVDFGGGPLTPTVPFDPVLAVFTPAGAHAWSKIFNGTGSQFGVGVTWAANEDVLVSCNGTGSIDMGGGVLTGSATKYNVFLGRYFGATGAHRWSTMFSAVNGVRGLVEEDHGKIILAGGVGGDVNFGGGVLAGLAAGDADAYLAEFTDVLYTGVSSPAPHASLGQNVPNPFNPDTRIAYTLEAPAHVMIDVFDAAGALVTRLDGGIEPAGAHAIKWDGRDRAGKGVASGVYFYRLDGMPEVEARRMVLLK